MGLREAYEGGAEVAPPDEKCGVCEWLETLADEDAVYADKILWEMKSATAYRWGADDAANMLKSGGCPVGHNVVGKHRRKGHRRTGIAA